MEDKEYASRSAAGHNSGRLGWEGWIVLDSRVKFANLLNYGIGG